MESNPQQPAAPLPNPARQATWFGFRVGRFGFLVPEVLFGEVIEQAQVNPLPNTQAWFHGLCNLRGHLVPVFDPHRLLGEEVADPRKRRLFAIGRGERAVALWIDGLPELRDAAPQPPTADLPLPEHLRPHAAGVHREGERLWLVPDYGAWFKALGRSLAST